MMGSTERFEGGASESASLQGGAVMVRKIDDAVRSSSVERLDP